MGQWHAYKSKISNYMYVLFFNHFICAYMDWLGLIRSLNRPCFMIIPSIMGSHTKNEIRLCHLMKAIKIIWHKSLCSSEGIKLGQTPSHVYLRALNFFPGQITCTSIKIQIYHLHLLKQMWPTGFSIKLWVTAGYYKKGMEIISIILVHRNQYKEEGKETQPIQT